MALKDAQLFFVIRILFGAINYLYLNTPHDIFFTFHLLYSEKVPFLALMALQMAINGT